MRNLLRNRRMQVALAAIVIALGGGAALHIIHDGSPAHHHGHGSGAALLKLNAGTKWEPDASLRIGMERIKALTEALGSTTTVQERQAYRDAIHAQIDYLIKNCQLPPDADETLHVLIGQIADGADAMPRTDGDTVGLALVRRALETYPKYFNHPLWMPLAGGKA